MTTKRLSTPVFEFTRKERIPITKRTLREALGQVRDLLLSHDINGGDKNLRMDTVCDHRANCGTAACIGGWASIVLLGLHNAGMGVDERNVVNELFEFLHNDVDPGERLYNLFYEYGGVVDYNHPNVAATAIQRYLDGKKPWPSKEGMYTPMPNVLPYKEAPKPRR